jgi:uncharacterized protein YidB (DUF937 family)
VQVEAMARFESVDGAFDIMPPGTRSGADFLATILSNTDIGGLAGMVTRLHAAGFDRQVDSWLGSGANLPITTEELRAALGEEALRQVADEFALPLEATLKVLAEQLPHAIDQASPDGRLREAS